MKYFKRVSNIILISLILGCPGSLALKDSGGEISTTAFLSLSLSAGVAKTILPPGISPHSYTITVDNGIDQYVFDTFNANPTFDIAEGTWDIMVEGKDIDGYVIASGVEAGVVLTIGSTTYVSIVLSALTGGSGSIDVTVDWSAADSVNVSTLNATLDSAAIDLAYLEIAATSVRYTENKSSGSYILIFYLDYGGASPVTVSEAVQVYDNLTSSAVIYLNNGDFTSAPSAPDNLIATTFSSTQIDLTWIDNSVNEDGFKIERSADGISFTQIAVVSSNTALYSDTGLNLKTLFYYRLRSYNSAGDSVYSNTAIGSTSFIDTMDKGYIFSENLSIKGFDRLVSVYIPNGINLLIDTPPLVIAMHGTGGDSNYFIRSPEGTTNRIQDIADSGEFIVIAPQARSGDIVSAEYSAKGLIYADADHWDTSVNYSTHWDMMSLDPHENNDLLLVKAIIVEAIRVYNIDSKKIYTLGMSNGAFFSSFSAIIHSDIIAGFAACGGGAVRRLASAPADSLPLREINKVYGAQEKFPETTYEAIRLSPNYPEFDYSILAPVEIPLTGRVPIGFMMHSNQDQIVSVVWTCELATAIGNIRSSVVIVPDAYHVFFDNFVPDAWSYLNNYTLDD